MISIALDLFMQQVWNIIYRKIKSMYSSETWQIGNSTCKSPFCHMNYFFRHPLGTLRAKLYNDFDLLFDSVSATAFVWGYMVPIFQLQFERGFTGSGLVHIGCIFYPLSCNVDVLIKHILAWLTKGVIYASNPPSVLIASLLIFDL